MIIPRLEITSFAILTSLLFTFPVKAALVTYQVEVNIDSGFLIGNQYTGTLIYDNTGLTGIGNESVLVPNFDFVFNGTTYTEIDDPLATIDFFEGDFLGLNYSAGSPAFPSFTSAFPPFFPASFSYDFGGLGGSGTGVPTFVQVPESSPLLGLWLFAGISLFRVSSSKFSSIER